MCWSTAYFITTEVWGSTPSLTKGNNGVLCFALSRIFTPLRSSKSIEFKQFRHVAHDLQPPPPVRDRDLIRPFPEECAYGRVQCLGNLCDRANRWILSPSPPPSCDLPRPIRNV